jgi:hypothetical protein
MLQRTKGERQGPAARRCAARLFLACAVATSGTPSRADSVYVAGTPGVQGSDGVARGESGKDGTPAGAADARATTPGVATNSAQAMG